VLKSRSASGGNVAAVPKRRERGTKRPKETKRATERAVVPRLLRGGLCSRRAGRRGGRSVEPPGRRVRVRDIRRRTGGERGGVVAPRERQQPPQSVKWSGQERMSYQEQAVVGRPKAAPSPEADKEEERKAEQSLPRVTRNGLKTTSTMLKMATDSRRP